MITVVGIICITAIACVTLNCLTRLQLQSNDMKMHQQTSVDTGNTITQEDLDEAYKKVEADNIPTMEELIQKCQNALDGDEDER